MEIIDGVYTIDGLRIGRAYLYREADRLTLIDTGLAGSAERIYEAVAAAGRRAEELRQIVITHYHNDHTGSLAEIAERTGADVLAHRLDAPVVRGEQAQPGPNPHGAWRLVAPLFARASNPTAPARVDREVDDGDEIDLEGGARVLHVPGHTPGSIAIYIPRRRLLFSGDAAVNALGLGPPAGLFGIFNTDRSQARASFRKLAELEFDVACFGHGKPLDREASLAFRRTAEKLGAA